MIGAEPRHPARGWPQAALLVAVLLAATLLLYRETALSMLRIWSRSDTFAHAFTVPPIVAWLIWRRRDRLLAATPRLDAWLLLPIAAAGGVWLLGDLASVNAAAQLAFTALLVLVTVLAIGTRASRTIVFPLAFLFFAVPLGEFVMPQMMAWTADFTVVALRLSGIPVYREGLQFVIPSGNWSVVEACSGVRYLMASVMVGVLFAYLNYRSLKRRLIFVGVSIVVPIVANWVRAYLIVLTGHLSGNTVAVGADHLVYGWVFFGIVITLMFMIGARWSEAEAAAAAPSAPPRADAVGAVPAMRPTRTTLAPVAAAAALLLLAAPPLSLWAIVRAERPGLPQLVAPSALAAGWQAAPGEVSAWRPVYQGAAAQFARSYTDGASTVGVFVAYYRHQQDGRKLVSSDNVLVPMQDASWTEVEAGTQQVDGGGTALSVRSAQLRGSGHAAQLASERLRVWRFYWINGTLTASDEHAKASAAWQRLLGRGDDAAVVIVYAEDEPPGRGAGALAAFVRANLHVLTAQLANTRDGN